VLAFISLSGGLANSFSVDIIPDFLFLSSKSFSAFGVTLIIIYGPPQSHVSRIIGFSIAAIIGLLIGIVMGMSRVVNSCLRSLFLGLQTLPTAAWVPVSLLIFGLSDRGIYFVIIMSSAPAVALAASDGIQHIPLIYLRVARTFGTPGYAMPARVILPASLPSIVTGLKLGWTLAWHGGVSAELIKSSIGLGFLLQMGRELNDAAQVIGIMVLLPFGLLLDRFVFG
jgi:NitT/TauT family transport system permease protein